MQINKYIEEKKNKLPELVQGTIEMFMQQWKQYLFPLT